MKTKRTIWMTLDYGTVALFEALMIVLGMLVGALVVHFWGLWHVPGIMAGYAFFAWLKYEWRSRQ